jgi:hypothetical protein
MVFVVFLRAVQYVNDRVRTSVSPSFWYIPTVNTKNKRTFLGFVGIGCLLGRSLAYLTAGAEEPWPWA